MNQCTRLLSLLKNPKEVVDFIDSLRNERGNLISCMKDKDRDGNTILHSIINNAAKNNFKGAKINEALGVYFTYLNSNTISPDDLQNLLTIENYSNQSPIEALIAKSSKFNDQDFIKTFCMASVLSRLNPEISNLFDNSMSQVFINDKDSILGCFKKYSPIEKNLHYSAVVYIKSLYKNEKDKSSIKLSDLADKAMKGLWTAQEDNLDYNAIPYYLISYGLEYKKSKDLLVNIKKNELALSKELKLIVHENTLIYKNSYSNKNMLIITGTYSKNDLMLGLDYTFHHKGFNICAINSNRYDKFQNHDPKNYENVRREEINNIKGHIQVCEVDNFDIAIIHAHGNPNKAKDPSDVMLKINREPPKISSEMLYGAIKSVNDNNSIDIIMTSCNGQLTNKVVDTELSKGSRIITFGENHNGDSISTRVKDVSNIFDCITKKSIPNMDHLPHSIMYCYLMNLKFDSKNVPIPTYSYINEDGNITSYLFRDTSNDKEYSAYFSKNSNVIKNELCHEEDKRCVTKIDDCIRDLCFTESLVKIRDSYSDNYDHGKDFFGVSAAMKFYYNLNHHAEVNQGYDTKVDL